MEIKICVVGLGFVGGAIFKSLVGLNDDMLVEIIGYDKDKSKNNDIKEEMVREGISGETCGNKWRLVDSLEECVKSSCDIMFLCLPTLYSGDNGGGYNYDALVEVINHLRLLEYSGIVVIKSTVTPGTVRWLEGVGRDIESGVGLDIVHNPEFLRERCAVEDFIGQERIIIGKGEFCSDKACDKVVDFYKRGWPEASIEVISALDSSALKIYINTFCSVKIQMLNELFLLSKQIGVDFDVVKKIMIAGNWIGDRHTSVPGYDGELSYGGHCLPKDSKALLALMKEKGCDERGVLEASISERDKMRGDEKS